MNGNKKVRWAVLKTVVAIAAGVLAAVLVAKIPQSIKHKELGTISQTGVVGPAPKTEKQLVADCLRDKTCKLLAEVGYYEARSESDEGMAAVMHVVLNRATYPKMWGSTPHSVVAQKHQFSYRWDGSMKKGFAEKKAYKRSILVAKGVIDGTITDITNGSNHYHTNYVYPKWRHSLKKKVVIGSHIFYDFKRG